MSWIEEKYLSLLSGRLRNFKKKKNGLWNFSCPEATEGFFCGDSKSNPRRARGFVFEKGNKLFYRCHNCGTSTTFHRLLQLTDSELYNQYNFERFYNSKDGPTKEVAVYKQKTATPELLEYCYKMEETKVGRRYLESRMIPRDKYDRFLYIDDFSRLTNLFPQYDKLPADARIVIPIYNRQSELCGLTGRAIGPSPLRYVMMKVVPDGPMIFGLDTVDLGKTVYAVEGAFDSIFIDNSIAVDGSDFQKVTDYVPKSNVIVVFDNQPRNREIVNKMQQIASDGFKIVVWPRKFTEYSKDINGLIQAGLTKDEISDIINRNIFSGLRAKLEINRWKMI